MSGIEEAVSVAARVIVGTVLLIAGLAKLGRRGVAFRDAILAYDLVPWAVARRLASVLPRLEITAGAGVLLGLATGVSAVLAYLLILLATAAVAISLVRGKRHRCGCLGFTGDDVLMVQWTLVYRNLMLLAALLAVVTMSDRLRVDAWIGWSLAWAGDSLPALAGWAWVACAGVVLVLRLARPPIAHSTSTNQPLGKGAA